MHRQHHHHHQQQAYKRRQLWKQPRFWFLLIIVIFIINLLIAFVTIERHISFATTSSSSFFENGGPPISSYSSASTLTSHRFITESRLWHRMLLMIDQEEEEKNDNNYGLRKKKSKTNNNNNNNQFICGEYHVNSRNNITTIDDNRNDNDDDDNDEDEDENTNTTRRNLVPFGFPNSVRSYVQKEQNRSSSIGSYCTAPPSNPSCQSSSYTVVVYSSRRTARSGSNSTNTSSRDDYWRQLVVRVMTFLAFPSVERVNLILREERVDVGVNDNKILHDVDKNNSTTTTTTLFLQNAAKRNKYAKRIQYWNEKDVVNVIPTTSLWDGLNRLDVPSESILWIDGDHYYNNNNNLSNNNNNINNNHNTDIPINGTKLKGRLRVWREIPNALIIPGDDTNTGDNNNNNNRIVSNLQQQQAAAAGTNSTTTCPFSSFPLLSLHGMMMHKNYLCYLNHPIIGSDLRNYTDSLQQQKNNSDRNTNADKSILNLSSSSSSSSSLLSWDITTIAIGVILFHISDGYVIDHQDNFNYNINNAITETKTTTKTNNRLSTIKNLSNGENENDHHNMDSHNNRRITRKTTIKHHIKKISKYFGVCPCFGEGGSGGSDLGTSMTMMSSSKRRMSAPSKLQCTNGSGT